MDENADGDNYDEDGDEDEDDDDGAYGDGEYTVLPDSTRTCMCMLIAVCLPAIPWRFSFISHPQVQGGLMQPPLEAL